MDHRIGAHVSSFLVSAQPDRQHCCKSKTLCSTRVQLPLHRCMTTRPSPTSIQFAFRHLHAQSGFMAFVCWLILVGSCLTRNRAKGDGSLEEWRPDRQMSLLCLDELSTRHSRYSIISSLSTQVLPRSSLGLCHLRPQLHQVPS